MDKMEIEAPTSPSSKKRRISLSNGSVPLVEEEMTTETEESKPQSPARDPDIVMDDSQPGSIVGEKQQNSSFTGSTRISELGIASIEMLQMNSAKWQKTIEKVIKSVVSIHFAQMANFDMDIATVSEATGFVVDSQRGIILTNRHVVGSGPFKGTVIFDNHEECDVIPIYRDPVHDFGFLKFDPSKIKYMEVKELKLKPELAKVGCEIRVVGNDAGEKLSILAGFISRIDRNPPDYGSFTYNDFNTEYIQAAASASGGSSGSPVINIDGDAVALQAGGSSESSTDFFLPLYRGKRALELIQKGMPVTRGTIQVEWYLKPYDDCGRLGLTEAAQKEARRLFPESIGLLVAETALPEGPADKLVEEGDCLISINGTPISTFIKVDEILDDNVGNDIELKLQRDGKDVIVKCRVQNLHDITPNRYVDVCGASFHNLSYQLARLCAVPVKGVYISSATGSFSLSDSYDEYDGSRGATVGVNGELPAYVLDSLDDKPVSNLDEFVEVMRTLHDRQRVTVTYRNLEDIHSKKVAIVYIQRHWTKTFKMAVRNDETGLWDFTDLGDPLPPLPIQPASAKLIDLPIEPEACSRLVRSFVMISCIMPLCIDGFLEPYRKGYGLVIDAEKGYVLVSRNIVPFDLCDVLVTVAESVVVPGKVIFLHPTQNYAIISYDPSLVLAPLETPKFSTEPLAKHSKVCFIGYQGLRVVSAETIISDISTVNIPLTKSSPRYRATNLDLIFIESKYGERCNSGILANSDGSISALWLSFQGERRSNLHDKVYCAGLDIAAVRGVIEKVQQLETPQLLKQFLNSIRILDVEFFAIEVMYARVRGVSEEWIRRFEDISVDQVQFLTIYRTTGKLKDTLNGHTSKSAAEAVDKLQVGDIVLAINGSPVTKIADLYTLLQMEILDFTIVRQKKEMTIQVPTVSTTDLSTQEVVLWCGAVLQKPHLAVRQQMQELHSEVYISRRFRGSPAAQYGIFATFFITHVNETETRTLEKFIEAVRKIPDNTYIKLRIMTFDNVPIASIIRTNYHYFPTSRLKFSQDMIEEEDLTPKPTKELEAK